MDVIALIVSGAALAVSVLAYREKEKPPKAEKLESEQEQIMREWLHGG